MATAKQHFDEGNALFEKGKFTEANKCFDEAMTLDAKFMDAYRGKFKVLLALGKKEETIEWCNKAIAVDPSYKFAYNSKANAYRALGENQLALEAYDKAISLDANWSFPHNGKGNALSQLGKYEEAIQCFDKAYALDSRDSNPLNGKATALVSLGKKEEAKEVFDKLITLKPKSALFLCLRGKLFSSMGKVQEALNDFKKAQEIVHSGHVDVELTPNHLSFINTTLKSIVEIDNIYVEVEGAITKSDQSSHVVKNLLDSIKKLKEKKDKVTSNMIAHIDNKDHATSDQALIFMKELESLKKELNQVQSELAKVKSDVKKIENQIEEIKQDLDNKLDDFKKKLEKELANQELSPEDQAKLKEYFKAFIETFSSTHVTSQVIDSGQVQLDTETAKASLLSVVASFAPFIGGILSQGIKSLGDFIESKEMKTNARIMKGLAVDATELSQLVGKAGFDIVLHKEKQQQILKTNNDELKKRGGPLLEKIAKFCENIRDQIDTYMYTKLYKTPQARLGHNDANELIGEWINQKIDPYDIQADFVRKITEKDKQAIETEKRAEGLAAVKESGRTSCCNLF